MVKTVALSESTWEKLKRMREEGNAQSFDELIEEMLRKSSRVPTSMFGADKKKMKKFGRKEREEMWKDEFRD